MSHSNGKISPPVNITDIMNVLGINDTRIFNLCRSTNVNMWSKWKPLPKTIIDTTNQRNSDNTWKTDAQLVASGITPWWKGVGGNYGIDFSDAYVGVSLGSYKTRDALNELALKIDGSNNGWYRLTPNSSTHSKSYDDFNGYNHNASIPLSSGIQKDVEASGDSSYKVTMNVRETPDDIPISNRDYLKPQDVTSYTLHVGLAIFKLSSGTYSAIAWTTGYDWLGYGINTQDGPDGITDFGDNGVSSKLKDSETYYLLPFFSSEELPQSAENMSKNVTSASTVFFTAPNTTFSEFKAYRMSSSQTIGMPELTVRKISVLWNIRTTLVLNSTYRGYNGGTATNVTLAIVNELWVDGMMVQGSYAYYNNFGSVVVGQDEVKTVGSTNWVILDSSHEWRAIAWVNGEKTEFELMSPIVENS